MTEEVNPQKRMQTNKYFLHYKQLNPFDYPYHIHKYLDSEPSTFLLGAISEQGLQSWPES